jgi:hypothetical protein
MRRLDRKTMTMTPGIFPVEAMLVHSLEVGRNNFAEPYPYRVPHTGRRECLQANYAWKGKDKRKRIGRVASERCFGRWMDAESQGDNNLWVALAEPDKICRQIPPYPSFSADGLPPCPRYHDRKCVAI